ncbi:MAG: hypothetical protein ACRDC7_19815 [Aeromonas veronii]
MALVLSLFVLIDTLKALFLAVASPLVLVAYMLAPTKEQAERIKDLYG